MECVTSHTAFTNRVKHMATKNEMMRRIDAGEFAALANANMSIGKMKARQSTKQELKEYAAKWFAAKNTDVLGEKTSNVAENPKIAINSLYGKSIAKSAYPSETNGKLHHRRAMTIARLYLNDKARALTLDYLVASKADGMSIDDMIREMSHSLDQLKVEGV